MRGVAAYTHRTLAVARRAIDQASTRLGNIDRAPNMLVASIN